MDVVLPNSGYLLAGELAKAAGVSTDTLRHYERKGVLIRPPRGANGYRLYPKSSLNRVLLVRRALSVGFTLDELAIILSEREKGGTPCRKVRKLLAEKLSNVEDQLITLSALRDELRLTRNDWDKRLSKVNADTQAKLLENLALDDRNPSRLTAKNERAKQFPYKISKKKGK